ncbi:zinc-ribbon domain-containing protein [Lysinibacillus sp. NPDC086135]|uniref:zinc-ribbon domain-containing protein n=1 Tax=Lysinibacillus sp. NPDC086135 TaxID=3364130 RepID=UPI00382BB25B
MANISNNTLNKYQFDPTIFLADNALLKIRPELWYEWDFKKNDELGIDIYRVTKGQGIKAWWKCKIGHEWDASIINRSNGSKCPYCSNKKVSIRYNDMWTTNPELASLLANPEDGFKYMQGSKKKVDWKCSECGEIIKNKTISDINIYGLSCPRCSDGISYPEKIMYHLLKEFDLEFCCQKTFGWSKNKRYDFYLPVYNAIIEMHGGQHSGNGFEELGGRIFEEEIKNDKLKEKLAKNNGIKRYIVIDAKISDFKYIKNNILNSDLTKLCEFNDVNWSNIKLNINKSFKVKIVQLFKDGYSKSEISEMLNLHISTIYRALKHFGIKTRDGYEERHELRIYQLDTSLRLIKVWGSFQEIEDELNYSKVHIKRSCTHKCETSHGYKWLYEEDYRKYISGELLITVNNKNCDAITIAQFDLNGELIKEWDSVNSVVKSLGLNSSYIIRVCNEIRQSTGGYKWMFLDDYLNSTSDDTNAKLSYTRYKKIVQLDLNWNYVNQHSSPIDAYRRTNIDKGSISQCCTGKRKTAGGFRWMYKEDFDDYIKN